MGQPGRFSIGLYRNLSRVLTQVGCLAAMAGFAMAAEPPAPSPLANQVAEHLQAGEFGLATEKSLTSKDLTEQAQLLKKVAAAQEASGEVTAAAGTIRRMARPEDRAAARTNQPELAGGMQGLMMLVRLIQQVTPGKWDQDEEGGQKLGHTNGMPMGVKVSPNGLLQRLTAEEQAGQLAAMGIRARKADLNSEIAQTSSLRMVSLTRLEKAVARRIEEGLPIPESMFHLAGMTQVRYVLVFPEADEIVLAGPASAWEVNAQGQPVSVNDGRPTLQLDDLVTVMRTFARGEAHFGCSINTRDEGVKALKEYAEETAAKGPIDAAFKLTWIRQLQQKLGHQDVVVWGVPGDSRVARVIVEADYRMKLIGIHKLDAGKEFPSYFDLLPVAQQKNPPNMEALRWWLTPKLDAVLHSPDKNVFEIQGSSVLCQSENQFLTAEGKHVPTGQSEGANQMFAERFTANYDKLAAKQLVFADTQNIFSLALCAALIKNQGLDTKAHWDMGVFAPGGSYTTASFSVPKEVDSVVNHRTYHGKNIVVQVAGGVSANMTEVSKTSQSNQVAAELSSVGETVKAPALPVGRWWWDASR